MATPYRSRYAKRSLLFSMSLDDMRRTCTTDPEWADTDEGKIVISFLNATQIAGDSFGGIDDYQCSDCDKKYGSGSIRHVGIRFPDALIPYVYHHDMKPSQRFIEAVLLVVKHFGGNSKGINTSIVQHDFDFKH